MKKYIDKSKSKTFTAKSEIIQDLIQHTLFILDNFGIPINQTARRLERMAIAFLAVVDVKSIADFQNAKDLKSDNYALKTRDIIEYVNQHFQENISSGSYDDIRRKDLKLLITANIVLQSNPKSATNDSTRGYVINPLYVDLIRKYPSQNWSKDIQPTLVKIKPLAEKLKRERTLNKIPVLLPKGMRLAFSVGKHNDLQKAIIEDFLPRYGYGANVLYVGDTADKYLHLDKKTLKRLHFFDIAHEELPDIIAYSKEKNWLYLIEAVHSSGAINEIRLLQLEELTKNCTAEIIYVTAFLDRITFRKYVAEVAWETEVWIADNPDHLIHFNGDKFLGPYKK